MGAVQEFAAQGGLVLGICNGFQILCEAGLLPGALVRNRDLQFHCEQVFLKTVTRSNPFTCEVPPGTVIRLPIAHGEGCYFADEATLTRIEAQNQILWQYCDSSGVATESANPNGSLKNIAGICNEQGNVAGLMPHPDRACESIIGSVDGRLILAGMIQTAQRRNTTSIA
jgi:phosphoribosylformylglycinamidine synthase